MAPGKPKVFISYSTKDSAAAVFIRDQLVAQEINVWLDVTNIKIGDRIADSISAGLGASDYFIILISDDSNRSPWVKSEISLAFTLAGQKKLSVVPILLKAVQVPFEFRGLLYIDARKSLKDGVGRLLEFFRGQALTVGDIDSQSLRHGMAFDHSLATAQCLSLLEAAKLTDLRRQLAERLSISDLKVLWFDVFGRKMDDEVPAQNITVGLASVELIDRSRRDDNLIELINAICSNHPGFDRHLR